MNQFGAQCETLTVTRNGWWPCPNTPTWKATSLANPAVTAACCEHCMVTFYAACVDEFGPLWEFEPLSLTLGVN